MASPIASAALSSRAWPPSSVNAPAAVASSITAARPRHHAARRQLEDRDHLPSRLSDLRGYTDYASLRVAWIRNFESVWWRFRPVAVARFGASPPRHHMTDFFRDLTTGPVGSAVGTARIIDQLPSARTRGTCWQGLRTSSGFADCDA